MELKLLDVVGKTLNVFTVNGSYSLSLNGLPSGVYYLQDAKGNKTYKLIKQ